MARQVVVYICRKTTTAKEEVNCLCWIKNPEEKVCYKFPVTHQAADHHAELFEIPSIKRAVRALSKVGHYRTLTVTLDATLAPKYIDNENNFLFQDAHLEKLEYPPPSKNVKPESDPVSTTDLSELLKVIKSLEKSEEFKIGDVEKNFRLEKFDGKTKAADWLQLFENECSR